MVKIIVAGGSGEVASEVITALAAVNKHKIVILSRRDNAVKNVNWRGVSGQKVDYDNKEELSAVLRGAGVVLSFIQPLHDPGSAAQKNLIDAAVLAGVKRFAPSDWGSHGTGLPLWAGKDDVKEYLKLVNRNGKVLEYCMFQPGLFLNYLATPHRTAEYLTQLNTFVDLENRRAIVIDGLDPVVSLTTVQDMAAVVVRAVDFEGEWPEVGGIQGNNIPISEIVNIGKRVRGGPFTVQAVKVEDLEAGTLTASWGLGVRHHSISEEEAGEMFKTVLVGILLGCAKGAWGVTDEWNKLLPDFKFTKLDDFLADVWRGKP